LFEKRIEWFETRPYQSIGNFVALIFSNNCTVRI